MVLGVSALRFTLQASALHILRGYDNSHFVKNSTRAKLSTGNRI